MARQEEHLNLCERRSYSIQIRRTSFIHMKMATLFLFCPEQLQDRRFRMYYK